MCGASTADEIALLLRNTVDATRAATTGKNRGDLLGGMTESDQFVLNIRTEPLLDRLGYVLGIADVRVVL